IQQIRDAAWKIEMNAKRIETTRAARELADQRLDAERKRLEVGMSTSFLVIQAQRDLAQGKTNELGAILAYDLALVDFEAVREAALEMRLQRDRAAADEPRPVGVLRVQQKIDTALVVRTRGRHRAAFGQRDERFAGRVGVARQRRDLRPSAVAALAGDERGR